MFKTFGFTKDEEKNYVQDADHNLNEKEKTQMLLPIIEEEPELPVEPEESEDSAESTSTKSEEKVLPRTGETISNSLMVIGLCISACVGTMVYIRQKKSKRLEK